MFRSKTTFVIGAGASFELNLPIGTGLTGKISETLRLDRKSYEMFSDRSILEAVREHLISQGKSTNANGFAALAQVAERIASNMPLAPSIDNYLNTHRSDDDLVTLGKIAITRCILMAERGSYLYARNGHDYYLPMTNRDLTAAWHVAFWQMLVAGVERDNLADLLANCRFIVFNYDRCLEHFLWLAIQSYFNVSRDEAAAIVNSADIVHAYGKVGGLPWMEDEVIASYGQFTGDNLNAIAGEIRTFTEAVDEGVQIRLRAMISDADSIVFLGFGFIEQNMALISPIQSNATRVFATALGMSGPEMAMAMAKIGQMIRKRPNADYDAFLQPNQYQAHIVNSTCSALFTGHRLRLADVAPESL